MQQYIRSMYLGHCLLDINIIITMLSFQYEGIIVNTTNCVCLISCDILLRVVYRRLFTETYNLALKI